jgi:hypothetical protein
MSQGKERQRNQGETAIVKIIWQLATKPDFLRIYKRPIDIGANDEAVSFFGKNKKACQSSCRLQIPG